MKKRRRVFHLGLWGPKVDEGVDWEIEHHMQERIDELVATGLSREDAEAQARTDFGDVARVRRELRGIDRAVQRRFRFGVWLETLLHDIRYGARGLRRNPGFAIAIMLTLGLGIGANVSLFSIVDALILRPLPYMRPTELHRPVISQAGDTWGMTHLRREMATALLERQGGFSDGFMHARESALYAAGAEPVTLTGEIVSEGFHRTLGVWPAFGRPLQESDAIPGTEPVVLLSHAFWRSALGSEAGVVGSTIELDDRRFTVVGVMPEGFKFPEYASTDFWVPISNDGSGLGKKIGRVQVVGRVPPQQLEAASAEIATVGSVLLKERQPETKQIVRLQRYDQTRSTGSGILEPIMLLSGAVLFILLVAGVNMVNLLLVRGSVRTREFAVRLAIGASRARLVRQLATESMLLAILSGMVAVVFAILSLRAVAAIIPGRITFFAPYAIEIESRALLFTFVVTAMAGFVFGLLPAFAATRAARGNASGDLTRYSSRSVASNRLRATLVVAEVALSVTLLVGAGLLIRSFVALTQVDPGFEPKGLAIIELNVSRTAHPDPTERAEYMRRLEAKLEAIPGVSGVTIAGGLPPKSGMISFTNSIEVEGVGPRSTGEPIVLPSSGIRSDFFEVTGARLLFGRIIEDGEENTVIIDQDMARFLFGNLDPLGRRFRIDEGWDWYTVVGVMKDLKLRGPDDRESNFEYLTGIGSLSNISGHTALAVRTAGDPLPLLPALRQAVHQVDPRQPIGELTTAPEAYAESIDMPRFLLVVVTAIAALALVLAAIGIYGVLAFSVSQRTHELGVRMALGARAADLRRMILRHGLRLGIAGSFLGLVGALALSRFIQAQLYQVQPRDTVTFASVLATISIATVLACLIPAFRASSVEPAAVLRTD